MLFIKSIFGHHANYQINTYASRKWNNPTTGLFFFFFYNLFKLLQEQYLSKTTFQTRVVFLRSNFLNPHCFPT